MKNGSRRGQSVRIGNCSVKEGRNARDGGGAAGGTRSKREGRGEQGERREKWTRGRSGIQGMLVVKGWNQKNQGTNRNGRNGNEPWLDEQEETGKTKKGGLRQADSHFERRKRLGGQKNIIDRLPQMRKMKEPEK